MLVISNQDYFIVNLALAYSVMKVPSVTVNHISSIFDAAGLHVFTVLRLQDAVSIFLAMDELGTVAMHHGMTAVLKNALDRLAPDPHSHPSTKDLYTLLFIIIGALSFMR